MYGRLNPVWSNNTLHVAQGVAQAIALAFGAKDSGAGQQYRDLVRRAFPEGE